MLGVRRRGFSGTAAAGLGAIALQGSTPTATGTNPPTGQWRLAAGHFIPAKMVPNIIFPRPDTETAVWAHNRRAPSAIEWTYRCVVQGGAFPGYWEIVSDGGATGLEFVRQQVPADFHTNGLQGWGRLRWTSPVVGTYVIQIRYTDQDTTTVDRTFTLEVISRENATYFMFLDAAAGNDTTGTGAFSSPRRTIAGWYGATKADSTHNGKQVYYRAGTYLSTDSPVIGATGQQVQIPAWKPHVHIAYPGEVATMDMNNTAYLRFEGNTGDICFQNLRWVNHHVAESSTTRNQYVRQPSQNRSQYAGNTFVGTTGAAGSGSNSSCVMFEGGGATAPQYFSICDNTFDAIDDMDYALFYDTSDTVCEGNIAINGQGQPADPGAGGLFFKALRISRVTVRANVAIDANIGYQILYFSQFTPGATDVRNDFEFCWNNGRNITSETASEGSGAVGIGQGDGTTGNHYGSFWSYRNNMKNPHITLKGIGGGGPFEFENDVIDHSGTYTDGFFIDLSSALPAALIKTNLATVGTLLDPTTNLLTGSARTTYLGTHGCEAV